MKIKIITTILLCCATAFASQEEEPTPLKQFQTLQKIFTSIKDGYPKTDTAIDSNHLLLATMNSESEKNIFFDIKKYSFDDNTEIVLQDKINRPVSESLLKNWATVTTPPFFLVVLPNDTVICAQTNGHYTLIKPIDESGKYTTGKPRDQSYYHQQIKDCASPGISITALSCNKNKDTSDILFGLSDGKIITINSDNLDKPITLQQPNNNINNAITSLYCLNNDKIIFSQNKTLYSLSIDSANTSNATQIINTANNTIEHTAFFEDAVAYCNTDNSITIIFDINNPTINNTFQMDSHQSKVNAICLHKKNNTYYLYIGDEEGNLTIWAISSDENNITSHVFATIPHKNLSISSIEVNQSDDYIAIKTVECDLINKKIISNKIISYPTPHMLKDCFYHHTNIHNFINEQFKTKKTETNSTLALYTLLKNNQSFLLTFPSNNNLAQKIKTHIEKDMEKLLINTNQSQAGIIDYLKKIKEKIGIDFTQNKYQLKMGEPLTPFNKRFSRQIINMAMHFLMQSITDQTKRAQTIDCYPLLKTSKLWRSANSPNMNNVQSLTDPSNTNYTETLQQALTTPFGIACCLLGIPLFITLAAYLYTLSKK